MFSHFITLCIFSVLFLHSILTPAYAADDAVINAGGKRQMTAYLGEILD
ncbi:hypothetical protein P4S55_11060 [Shewanella sp. PP-Sp27a-2]